MTTRTTRQSKLRTVLLATAACGFAATIALPPSTSFLGGGKAFAQSTGGGGGGGGSGQGHRGTGSGMSGAPAGTGRDNSGTAIGRGHYGQGGSSGEESEEGTDSDKKGPRFGGGENTRKPEAGTTGGRPVWAKEGIPEVELGRLSVARAPASVLQHALTEVTTNWTATTGSTVLTLTADGQPTLTMTVAELYSKSAEEFAHIVATYYASVVRIDSPLENLALLKDIRTDNTTVLTGVTPASSLDLAAIFLGSASDKTIPVSADTVTAVNTILQLPALTPEQTAELAAKAEAVRLAIDTGHSE